MQAETGQAHKFHEARCHSSPTPCATAWALQPQPIVLNIDSSIQHVGRTPILESAKNNPFWLAPDFWVAVFTGVLTLATILMWWATRNNAIAANRAAKVAERALIDLERPYLFVRYGAAGLELRDVKQTNLSDGGVQIEFASRYSGNIEILFVNFGRSPAIITEILDAYDRTSGLGAMPDAIDPDQKRGKKLPIGTLSSLRDPHSISKRPYGLFGNERLEVDAFKKDRFFCIGHVRYEDLLGGRYIVGYCGCFDPISGKFLPEGGDAYNYTRTERDPRGA